jgi:predicted ArsR family transcriptional regulator
MRDHTRLRAFELADALGLLKEPARQELQNLAAETSKVLNGLLRALRKP